MADRFIPAGSQTTQPQTTQPQAQTAQAQPTGSRFIAVPRGTSAPMGQGASSQGIAPTSFLSLIKQGLGIGNQASGILGGGQTMGNVLGGLSGLTNVALGAYTGNPYTLTGGALGTLGSASNLALPAMGASSGLTQGLGSTAQGLGGLLGVAGGIQGLVNGGNPLSSLGSLASGAYGAYQGLGSLANQLGLINGTGPSITDAIASMLGTTTSALAGPTAGLAMGLTALNDYFSEQEALRARESGWWNNPIKGNLYSNATSGVANANQRFQEVGSMGLDKAPTDALISALVGGGNSLMPYYATAQGGTGGIRASDTVTGTLGQSGYTGDNMSPETYTGNFTRAQQSMVDVVNELMRRGMSYEDLGKLPISGDWVQAALDMNPNYLNESYQRNAQQYDAQLNDLIAKYGPALGGQVHLTPQDYFQSVQGAAALSPDANSHASGLITGMYGGPLWTMLARMGTGGDQIQNLIQQHFNPWFLPQQGGDFGGFTYGDIAQRRMLEQQGLAPADLNWNPYTQNAQTYDPTKVAQLMWEAQQGSQGGA